MEWIHVHGTQNVVDHGKMEHYHIVQEILSPIRSLTLRKRVFAKVHDLVLQPGYSITPFLNTPFVKKYKSI